MAVTYTTVILGFDNHAAIEIPDQVLTKLGASRRAQLIVTVNGHTYRSTSTGMNGKCLVVFPQKDRDASGIAAGDKTKVTLELEVGRRDVEIPADLAAAGARSAHRVLRVLHAGDQLDEVTVLGAEVVTAPLAGLSVTEVRLEPLAAAVGGLDVVERTEPATERDRLDAGLGHLGRRGSPVQRLEEFRLAGLLGLFLGDRRLDPLGLRQQFVVLRLAGLDGLQGRTLALDGRAVRVQPCRTSSAPHEASTTRSVM